MAPKKIRQYLNDLEILSAEIRQSSEFSMDGDVTDRQELMKRFELNRNLVNLLHYVTIHMMRAHADLVRSTHRARRYKIKKEKKS